MNMLHKISSIARDAGEIIMKYYLADTKVTKKADNSPVTIADQEAEALIIESLNALEPDIKCIGEESALSTDRPSQLERYWCIDPLDGTREFIANSPEFTVNIALIEKGEPVVGVIYAPALDLMYAADKNNGAFKQVSGESGFTRIAIGIGDSEPYVVTISRRHRANGLEEALFDSIREVRPVEKKLAGSSLKFCMVAEGSADLYYRPGRTMFWDTAAGHVIAKAAGAEVLNWNTQKELRYNNDSLANPPFIVYNPKRSKGLF